MNTPYPVRALRIFFLSSVFALAAGALARMSALGK